MVVLLATLPVLFDIDPWDLVRVDDPDHPEAITRSATGSVLAGPPEPGVTWRWASIPETDAWPATEALEVTNADLWIADGVTGGGVKVAVFDGGWWVGNSDFVELGDDVHLHDCFLSPTCEVPFDPLRPDLRFESGVHGLACAEVIHDLAPEAELHLVRVNSFTTLENAVDWAIREGIDLISMSLSYTNESFYDGTGPHAALMERLEAAGVLMVTSAGNNATQHWYSAWEDGDQDGRLDGDGDNGLWLVGDGSVTAHVNWNQHGRCGDTDLDAYLLGPNREIYAASEDVQLPVDDEEGGRCAPIERLRATVPESGFYRVEVVHKRGPVDGLVVDLLTRSADMLDAIPERSITDPGVHPMAFAVGAVRAANYWDGPPEGFSSWGPTHGGHAKPEIAGPDGLSTDSYGPVGFFGTSASTPAVVGLLALLMSDDPELSPRQAGQLLQAYARSDTTAWSVDPRFGAGKARLPIRDPGPAECGRRPLVMPLWLLPIWALRSRRRRRAASRGTT